MAFIDFNGIMDNLGLSAPGDSARVTAWISEALDRIAEFCGQRIEQTTVTNEVFSGNGRDTYTFFRFPVTSVSALAYRSGIGTAATWTAIPTTDWSFFAGSPSILYPAGFGRGVSNYRVTYTYGYADGAAPGAIVDVVREMVGKLYMDHEPGGGARFGLSSTSQGGAGGSIAVGLKDFLPEWRAKLAPFRVTHSG